MEVPHVVIFPLPAQGHIKPMLNLAQLLSHAGLNVTFVNTDHNHRSLRRSSADESGRLQLVSIPDGFPPDEPRTGIQLGELILSGRSLFMSRFKEILIGRGTGERGWSAPTCIIVDAEMCFAMEVGEELGIPIMAFRTYSAYCSWADFHLAKLIEEGEIPHSGEEMDRPIKCIPGLEGLLRRRDLPGLCRVEELQNPFLQYFLNQTKTMARASALILNTFEDLEAPMIGKLRSLIPKIYTIGPLHALLKSHIKDKSPPFDSASLKPQDRTCLRWLDSQPSKSVLYVSFGSLAALTHDQLLEFWYGLVNSGKLFLWVIRSDLFGKDDWVHETPEELVVGTKKRGCIVSWVPQEEVLVHQAIGGFFTHSGWNSTIESIFAGVPMICWPQFGDQQVNSRCVSELWRIGLDMKDKCDRSIIEKMVRDLMEGRREFFFKSTAEIARMAHDSVSEGGSSCGNLEKLIEDIRSINLAKCLAGNNK